MTFAELGLDAPLLESVEAMGFQSPTPIQAEAIPYILQGRDVLGCAQTGTGKTAAFILPSMQLIERSGAPRVLVVTPTRELAQQVYDVALQVSKYTHHSVLAVYGGVGYDQQLARLKKGVDVLVATPGRLLDLRERRVADLSQVNILVLDEADRMLDMGFLPDVRKIISLLPKKRQNLLFSATLSADVLRVVRAALDDPISVEVGQKAQPVDEIEQAAFPVSAMQKVDLLVAMLAEFEAERVLVFTRTKVRADRVARSLVKAGIDASVMHSDHSQTRRQQALEGFRDGKHTVLVATEIIARGIDVEDISHVINYDVPDTPESYVHRIGRTARAGSGGTAYTLLAADEITKLQDIEAHLGYTLDCRDVEGFAYKTRAVPAADRPAQRTSRAVFSSGIMRRSRSRRIR